MAIPVKNILDSIIAQQADWRLILLQKWDTIVGGLKTRIRLEKIYDNTLVIGVYEAHWMQELFLLSRVITSSINVALGQPRITHLRFKLVEEKKRPQRIKKNIRAIKPLSPVILNEKQQSALHKIEDQQLQEALTNFLARCNYNNILN